MILNKVSVFRPYVNSIEHNWCLSEETQSVCSNGYCLSTSIVGDKFFVGIFFGIEITRLWIKK